MAKTTLTLSTYTLDDDEKGPPVVSVTFTPARLRQLWRFAFFVRHTGICMIQDYDDSPVWGDGKTNETTRDGKAGDGRWRISQSRLVINDTGLYFVGYVGHESTEIYTEAVELRELLSAPLGIRLRWTLLDGMQALSRYLRREPRPITEADLEALENQIVAETVVMRQQTSKAARHQYHQNIAALKRELRLATDAFYDLSD